MLWSEHSSLMENHSWQRTSHDRGPCFLLDGWALSLGELQLRWKYVVTQCWNVRWWGTKPVHAESQSESQLPKILQHLVNAWLIELWDDSERGKQRPILEQHKISTSSRWKKIMKSCCDHRISDRNSLMERCPYNDDDVASGEGDDVGAGDNAGASLLNSGLGGLDKIHSVQC